jgi:hypothetical protein
MLYRLNSDPDDSAQVLWEDSERLFCRGWRIGKPGATVEIRNSVTQDRRPDSLEFAIPIRHVRLPRQMVKGRWSMIASRGASLRHPARYVPPGPSPIVASTVHLSSATLVARVRYRSWL